MATKFRSLALCIVAVWAGAGVVQAAQSGTSQVPRYTPRSPTVSPYLHLLSQDGSVATNYFTLVRPLQQQRRINEQTAQQATTQQQQLQKLQTQQQTSFDQPPISATGTSSWFETFGQKQRFQTSDHFYGQWQTEAGQSHNVRANKR